MSLDEISEQSKEATKGPVVARRRERLGDDHAGDEFVPATPPIEWLRSIRRSYTASLCTPFTARPLGSAFNLNDASHSRAAAEEQATLGP